MLRIRLSRRGKKKQPHYRVVVADVHYKRDGRFVENIGYYNPLTDPPTIQIKEDRALHWLSVGAQPSDPVRHFLEKQGTYERLKRLHAGEALDALVAEYAGPEVKEEPKAKKAAKGAREKAAEVIEEVKEKAAEVAEEVKEVVAEAVEKVEETVAEVVEEAKETAAEVVEEIKEAVTHEEAPETEEAAVEVVEETAVEDDSEPDAA